MSEDKDNQHNGGISEKIANIDKIDELSRKMDNMRVAEYIEMASNPKRIIFLNFVAGLIRGLGMGIGFTILAGVVLYMMRRWVNLPVVGRLIAELLDIVDTYR
ncbi:MAG: DUF5665 domain-containing protein [Natronincolaceae bacterium]|jgi:hypothetical protein|nr:DUF5665 domain-containing protein [Bacillota bacterium]